jgi:hypothetical protein
MPTIENYLNVTLGALQNLPSSIAWKLPTPGTGFGSGAGIIIHAVGVPGADWFWERQFHPRRRRVAGGRGWFREE